ncbi:MAG: NAD(P)/FAD-dependent oxidoreductase [Myxococcales bacterium]
MAQGTRVLIVGGGFGGLAAARTLAGTEAQVTLLDRRNHHLFQPLLYQVATAALNPSNIATPIRRILRHARNVDVALAEATAVDVTARRVRWQGGELDYDYLIVAAGAGHSYFGHPEWERFAPGLKTVEDALDIRRRVLLAYEAAERERDPAERRRSLTFVIVGGGPTGVELAGALAEIARKTLAADFRHFDPREASVILVEAGPRLLPAMSEASSAAAHRQLERLGVEVVTSEPVTAIDAGGASLGPRRLEARTVLWAAGVAAAPLARTLGAPLDRAGRVKVQPDLSLPGAPEIFVVGDLASLEQDGKPVPGVAPAAMQEGRCAARNALASMRGRPRQPFRYRDKGTLATVGRAAAVADLGRLRLSGFVAWLAWLLVHILELIGFRNRLLVLIDWAWLYLTFERGARLITGELGPASEGRGPERP